MTLLMNLDRYYIIVHSYNQYNVPRSQLYSTFCAHYNNYLKKDSLPLAVWHLNEARDLAPPPS